VSVTRRLPTGFVLHAFDTVGSTNDEALRLAEAGAAEGHVVFAREQTRGRGRYGRRWQSPPGNLYASVLLRPDRPPGEAAQLSLLAGLALAEAIERFAPPGLDLSLKWPNDVLVRGAKTAGVLLESGTGPDGKSTWVIVGSGVNIAHCPADVPYPATALRREGLPAEFGPLDLLEAYLERLAAWLARWRADDWADIRTAWRARSYGLGRDIRLRLAKEELSGRFVDLTCSGSLLLEQADGVRREIAAGDVLLGNT
jgi:BirA family biotin operon repressor/biotin-[acetyl-CoA-carboxylase] ligase